ncbi:hypothetical protein UR09_03325 [Candidatus Nitromaritima sp. SCGC AAA799-A02]|nr:hypothetical protein UR09_03325 [Candidatus Nitromaritima sp. SCGC AAA799-A02]
MRLLSKIFQKYLIATLIFFLTFAVFSSCLENGFINWDDDIRVYENALIQSSEPSALWEVATRINPRLPIWQPLPELFYAVNYRLFGSSAWGHHFTSLTLHGANTCLVFFLFIALIGKIQPEIKCDSPLILTGAATALIFGLHPLRVESVAWISNLNEPLCGFFLFSALLTYLLYTSEESARTRSFYYLATLILFPLALLSKPMAVTLPVILLLLDVYPLKRFKGYKKTALVLLEKLPFFALSLLSGIITIMAREQGAAAGSVYKIDLFDGLTDAFKNLLLFEETANVDQKFSFAERIISAVGNLTFYMEKTLLPFQLTPYYPFPKNPSFLSLSFITSALAVAGITVLCAWGWKRGKKFWLIVWLYYLITILPVLGLLFSGRKAAAADRYTYISTLSFYLLAGAGALWTWRKSGQPLVKSPLKASLVAGSAALIILFCLLVPRQIQIWKDGGTLWSHITTRFPGKLPLAHNQLGNFFRDNGMTEKAKAEYKKALRIDPRYAKSHNNLGMIYLGAGRFEEAEKQFRTALEIHPQFPGVHNNFGLLYQQKGNPKEAENEYKLALQADPKFEKALNNLGLLYLKKGQTEEAEEALRSALKTHPRFAEAHNNLGLVYLKKGQREKAVAEFETALKLNPDLMPAYKNLIALHGRTNPN